MWPEYVRRWPFRPEVDLGETRVDLLHLLEDLRDAYPGSLEETILTEILANALDSGAATIAIDCAPDRATLTVADDGSGMNRRDLARYHDIATSSKRRGEGIGFAGVGIKLGLLVSEEVVTESRRGSKHVATSWRLASRHRAPWRWVPPPGMVTVRGTAVRLALTNPLSPLLDRGFVEVTLRRHFEPLLTRGFEAILQEHYPEGVRLVLNGAALTVNAPPPDTASLSFRLGRRRKPAAVGYLMREADELPEDRRGVAVSTLGKVIRRGWDWLGLTPAQADRITGLIEVPGLAACLTLNKADFLRSGERGAVYLSYRRAIQEQVADQLARWGDAPEAPIPKRRKVRPLERDLETVLVDLARDFPLLSALVDQRRGGQRRLPLPEQQGDGDGGLPLPRPGGEETAETERSEESGGTPEAEPDHEPSEPAPKVPESPLRLPEGAAPLASRRGKRAPAHYRLEIQFEMRTEGDPLGRLADATVWVNTGHPAYQRAVASRSEGYHLAVVVGMVLAPLAVTPAEAHRFIERFLARWGEGADGRGGRARSVRRRGS